MSFLALILLATLAAALPLAAADKVSVQQLRNTISAAEAAGDSDIEIARKISKMTLTERLTERTLASLMSGAAAGPETKDELQILADQTAFLTPPTAEMFPAPRPAMIEQRLIIARATNYTANYIGNLPDFLCDEVIRRLDDNGLRRHKNGARWKHIQLSDTVVQQLTFSRGKESATVETVNGHPQKRKSLAGLTTEGEFGNMLASMFLGNSNLKAWWSHWEIVNGRRLAVFHYMVDQAHSRYEVSYCCGTIRTPEGRILPNTIRAAYKGELTIDPATGTIFRASWQTVGLPTGFPTRQTGTVVEYRPVDIGGRSYICPVKSVTLSDSVMYISGTSFTYPLHSINEARFTQYRKFQTDSAFMARREPAKKHGTSSSWGSALPSEERSGIEVQAEEPFVPSALPLSPAADSGGAREPEESEKLRPLSPFPLPLPPPFRSERDADLSTRPTFQEHLNVVRVPVVVRDSHDRAVAGLTKGDFELFDNRKREMILGFSVEHAGEQRSEPPKRAEDPGSSGETAWDAGAPAPDRYVAYLVDNLHLNTGDLLQARQAARRVVKDGGDQEARAAVFSTSGEVTTDFTRDEAALDRAWKRIAPIPQETGCPAISYYLADRIINGHDEDALKVALGETINCGIVKGNAASFARAAARESLNEHERQNRRTLAVLEGLVRRMAVLPGQRTVLLISSGFYTPELSSAIENVVDRAARNGVVVDVVDARGVYVAAGYSAQERGMPTPEMDRLKQRFANTEQQIQSDVLAQLTDGTGGSLFESNNNLYAGIRRSTERPELSYLLEFTPAEEKADGSFHKLKVRVTGRKDVTVQARRGYLAPESSVDPQKRAKQEIGEAVFSHEEMNGLPVTLQTHLVRSEDGNAKLTVTTHVDIHSVPFERQNGHARDRFMAVVALFDQNGEYVKGLRDKFELDFPEDVMPARMASGISFHNELDVNAGDYLLRLVLRDEQGKIAAVNARVLVR